MTSKVQNGCPLLCGFKGKPEENSHVLRSLKKDTGFLLEGGTSRRKNSFLRESYPASVIFGEFHPFESCDLVGRSSGVMPNFGLQEIVQTTTL